MPTKHKRPSKLETLLAMSIKLAKMQRQIADLEAEVLRLGRQNMFHGYFVHSAAKDWFCDVR